MFLSANRLHNTYRS